MVMPRRLVHLDCDGILADFVDRVLASVNELTGLNLNKSWIKQWDFWDDLAKATGLPGIKAYVLGQLSMPGWCASISPCEGAYKGLKELRKVADVHIVTSPWISSETWCYERSRWLQRYMGVKPEDVTFSMRKELVGQEGDIFIDDRTKSVDKWNQVHGNGGYLWMLPWNNEMPELPRVDGWDDVIALVEDT